MIRLNFISLAIVLGMIMPGIAFSQCPEVLDNEGFATSNPTWHNCDTGSEILSIETSSGWTNLVIDWGDGSALESVGAFNPGDPAVEHTFAGDASSYTVTLSEADGSCSIEGHYFSSPPVSDFWSSSQSVCQGNSIQFHQEATGVQYSWNFGVNPNFLNTSTGHVSFTFQNPGQYTIQSVIQYAGTNGACTDTSSIEVTVLPKPVIDMNLSATEGCGSLTVSGDVSAPNSYLYVWSFMPSPTFQVGTTLDPITFNNPGNHPISVAVTGVNGCQATSQQFVTVHHQPVADFAFNGTCIGETTEFTDESTIHYSSDITGWYWQFGDGSISYESNPTNDYAFTGDYNVSLTVTTPECSASTSQLIEVNPLPSVEASANVLTGCSPLEVDFEATGSLAAEFEWNIEGQLYAGETVNAVIETALNESDVHTATVVATSTAGCTASDEVIVQSFPRAIAQIQPAVSAGCAPLTLGIANQSQGANAYEWYANDVLVGSTADWDGTLENTSNTIQNQTVELVALSPFGCHDTTAAQLQVYPQADFTFDLPNDTACSPLELTMPYMEGVNSLSWNFGGGNTSNEQTPSITLENTNGGLLGSSITFTGVSVFGCIDSHTETVYVRPQPVAEFSSDATEGCEPLACNLENISSDADSYIWDFGNGISDDGPTAAVAFYASGAEPENFTITLTAIDDLGCTDTDSLEVTVYPAADFVLDLGVESVCSPLEMSMPAIEGAQNFQWNFGDGTTSTEATPFHTWANDSDALDSYIVTLSAETAYGCDGFAVDLIHIKPQPTAAFYADVLNGCEPLESNFVSSSSLADQLTWSFGDGNTAIGTETTHSFTTSGVDTEYSVTLTATHALGCEDTFSQQIEVFAAAEYALNLSNDSVCSPLVLTMPEFEGAQNVQWNFGDGTTSTESTPTHTWNNNTGELMTATITLTAETSMGCVGTSETEVHIKPQPIADFSVNYDAGCNPLVSQFNNESALADSYDWDFGDGSTDHSTNPTHAFEATNETTVYDVTLTAHDDLGCSDVTSKQLTVFPAADFELSLTADTVCSPLVLTMPTIAGAQNIQWDFGDGTTAVGQNPTHTWNNDTEGLLAATVSFVAQTANGCIGTASSTVYIKPQPTADFAANVVEGCSPLAVQFNNLSTQADSFVWDFNNGSTATSENPNATFVAEATNTAFEVSLTAIDELGCSSSVTREVIAFPAADFSLNLPTDSVCSPLELTLPTIPGGTNITWDFGDGATASGQAPQHAWVNSTSELMSAVVTFSGETLNGCVGAAQATVHIRPQPVASFTANETEGCEPFGTTFNNMSENGDVYIWNFNDTSIPVPGEVNNGAQVEHTFTANDQNAISEYNVTLMAIDNLGCTDEANLTISVSPTPTFDLELEVAEGCSPLTLTMPAMSNAVDALWTFGDGTMSNELTPEHTWNNASDELLTSEVSFEGSNAFGCVGNASAQVEILPQPQAIFELSAEAGCAPFEVELFNNSINGDDFQWTYGDGTSSSDPSEAHAYTFNGESELAEYTISLTTTHALGCVDTQEKSVTVMPEIVASWEGLTEGCAPLNTSFIYTGTPTEQINWTIDGTTAGSGNLLDFQFAGDDNEDATFAMSVEAISQYGCSDALEFDVTVHPVPVLALSLSSETTCSGEEWMVSHSAELAETINLTLNGSESLTNPDANIILNTVNEGADAMPLAIELSATSANGCDATASSTHTVFPAVTASFVTPAAVCSPLEAQFENTSINADGQFAWNFGDGTTSAEQAPVHLFEATSTENESFAIELIATSAFGCADTTQQTVTVWGVPTADLSIESLEGCYPVDVTFVNGSEGHEVVEWNYGNGEFGLNQDSIHTKTFFNPTSELITYTTAIVVQNDHGCSATDEVEFEVGPYLNAQFDVVTEGCSPVEAEIINQSEGAAAFIWNFNDGSAPSNEENPVHTFLNTTDEDVTYHMELIAMSAYGCADTLSIGVDVYATPHAQFSVSPAIQTYPNTTVGINNSSVAAESAVQYWSFGDGDEVASDQPIFHTYNSWGTYNITLLVDNGFCADAHTEQITILSPHPVASFTGSGSGCAPLTVEFENNSNHGAQYIWDFGDDVMTSEESPTHEFTRPGVYHVSLTVIGHEGQEEQVVHYGAVEVFPSASAAFVHSPSQVIVPDQPVDFVNLSDIDATEFHWDFGDGTTSSEMNPVHFYTEPGSYTVTLTANNDFNCPTTYVMENAVQAIAGGFMEFPTAFTPNTGGSNGGYYDPAALDNDVFHPHHSGIVEYELVIFNKWGELLFRSTDPYIGWDGYFQGQIVRQDVYAWKAVATFSNGYRTIQAGDVTLIK